MTLFNRPKCAKCAKLQQEKKALEDEVKRLMGVVGYQAEVIEDLFKGWRETVKPEGLTERNKPIEVYPLPNEYRKEIGI